MKLEDGRAFLYQWDTGRKLIIEEPCSKVSFSNAVNKPLDVEVKDGVALIPDELLQMSFPLQCWAFVGTPETGYTRKHESFQVYARPRPADYVFTPTQQLTISQLIERIERVEDPTVIKTVVEDYLEQNPVEAPVMSVNGKTGAVKLNAADVGALAASSLPSAINTALAQAKANGEFDGAPGPTGPQGPTGATGATGPAGKDGAAGAAGKDGTSVTVKSVSESSADGGSNVVTFSDGKTLTIKNGSKGSQGEPGAAGSPGPAGYTPVKGTDYYTPADKAEMVNSVLAALPTWTGGSY